MENQDNFLLDNVWIIWNHIDNESSPELVEACMCLIGYYDFDIDCLPERLWEGIKREMGKQDEDAYWEDQSQVVTSLESHLNQSA